MGRPDRVLLVAGAGALLLVVLWAILDSKGFAGATGTALDWVLATFGWLFIVAGDVFLVAAVVLAVSRYGRVRLGSDDESPEFTNLAWVAMMFSAGMGIGLMFYGVAEPMQHYFDPRPDNGIVAQSPMAARHAMTDTLFHWTLHPWGIYAVAGLALAYSTFRKKRGNRFSDAFRPLLGRRVDGGAGRALDLFAIWATVFGTAASLGLGALQVEYGFKRLTGLSGTRVEVLIIVVLTGAFVVSAFSGVHRGVKWLSTSNVVLAGLLALMIFVTGPTLYVLNLLPASIGDYLSDLVVMSTRTGAFGGEEWLSTWTIFYWAWWLSWAPFVGAFIARISRGRTVREFVVGVLLVPSGASAVWFAISGGSALRLQQTGQADLSAAVKEGPEAALYGLLDALPLADVTSFVAIVLVALYFITGADSASLVLGSLSSGGSLRPPRPLVVMWGVLVGAVAIALLLAGGLNALQQATILVALPFVVVMLGLCLALVRELRDDPAAQRPARTRQPIGFPAAVYIAARESPRLPEDEKPAKGPRRPQRKG